MHRFAPEFSPPPEEVVLKEIERKVRVGEIKLEHLRWFAKLKLPELDFLLKWWKKP